MYFILMYFYYTFDSAHSSQALCHETMAVLSQDAKIHAWYPASGTYSFNPSSSSAQSVLDKVNAEEDGAEDRDGPLLDLSHANITGTFFSSNLNILGFGALSSKPSSSHSHPLVALGHHHRPLSPQWPIQTIPTQLSHVTYLLAQAWCFLTPIAILATPNIKNENMMDNWQGAHALPAPNVRLRAKRAM